VRRAQEQLERLRSERLRAVRLALVVPPET
jgi:hypothetical protein